MGVLVEHKYLESPEHLYIFYACSKLHLLCWLHRRINNTITPTTRNLKKKNQQKLNKKQVDVSWGLVATGWWSWEKQTLTSKKDAESPGLHLPSWTDPQPSPSLTSSAP